MPTKHDNKTYEQKVRLRLSLRSAVEKYTLTPPSVVETHGGFGRLFQRVYADRGTGVVFETDEGKAGALALQRPGWSVYASAAEDALARGVGYHFLPNLFDLDPYGSPWEAFAAICAHAAKWARGPVGFVVNDGLRPNLQKNQSWRVKALADALAEFGNAGLYRKYLTVCRWQVERAADRIGRRLTEWTGYYCGSNSRMSHYAFVLG
jgi:hypothetical protein